MINNSDHIFFFVFGKEAAFYWKRDSSTGINNTIWIAHTPPNSIVHTL